MIKRLLLNIALVALCAFTSYLSLYNQNLKHEEAHYQIAKYYGCQNGSISLGFLAGNHTCLDSDHPFIEEEYNLHALNEIVGYNLTSIHHSILALGSLAVIILANIFLEAAI